MIQIIAISGSIRRLSLNKTLLSACARVAPSDVKITLYEGLDQLPIFNPDLEGQEPKTILELRSAIRAADAVLIASPEYAHGITGALKNGLDWLVGSGELVGKPVGLLNASNRAKIAYAQTQEILTTMDARLILPASLTINVPPASYDTNQLMQDPTIIPLLRQAISELCKACEEKM